MFNNKFCRQLNGVAIEFPLGPALANIFMCNFENKWLRDYPLGLKPVFYKCYVDGIFLLFSTLNHEEKFKGCVCYIFASLFYMSKRKYV